MILFPSCIPTPTDSLLFSNSLAQFSHPSFHTTHCTACRLATQRARESGLELRRNVCLMNHYLSRSHSLWSCHVTQELRSDTHPPGWVEALLGVIKCIKRGEQMFDCLWLHKPAQILLPPPPPVSDVSVSEWCVLWGPPIPGTASLLSPGARPCSGESNKGVTP